MNKVGTFLKKALIASDLMQGYVDKALDELEKLDEQDCERLQTLLKKTKPKGAEEAAAIAVLQYLVKIPKEKKT